MNRLTQLLIFSVLLSMNVSAQNTAPDFSLKNTKGITYSMYDELNAGKAVLLCFFSISCGPCADDVQKIQEVYKAYNSDDFTLMAIETFIGSNNEIEDFISRYGGSYVGFSCENQQFLLSDTMFDVTYTPQNIVVCPDKSYQKVEIEDVQLVLNNCILSSTNSQLQEKRYQFLNVYYNDGVLIKYFADNEAALRFEIVDILGNRRISQIVNTITGDNEISLKAKNLTPGYYFIRMIEGNSVMDLKKIVIY